MGSEAQLQQLYDAYLNALIEGEAEPPEQFLRAAGVTEATLRERLEQLYQLRPDAQECGNGSSAGNERNGDRALDAAAASAGAPPRLGEFILRERLGEGGMGVVYLAEQPSVGRVVALKVIRPEFARSASAAARFDREARAIARLRHPNIVTVHAVGEDRGIRYIAMEYVEGATLSELLAQKVSGVRCRVSGTGVGSRPSDVSKPGREPTADSRQPTAFSTTSPDTCHLTPDTFSVSLPTTIRWMAALARALQYAHENGIVHRDVKPSNIRITPTPDGGRPLLLDFGLARDLSSQAATLTEAFIGSPQYVAPELIGSGRAAADGRADVYSLGVVLYECMTGAAPFGGDSLEQVLHAILMDDPPPPRGLNRAIPRDLNVIVMKAIEKDPKQRYASAGELADDLEALMEFRPIRAKPPTPVQRGWKWCRRHPARSAGGAAVAFAGLLLAAILTMQNLSEQRQRRADAAETVAQAAALVEQYRGSRAETEPLEAQYVSLRRAQTTRYFTPEEDRLLADAENDVLRARNRREQMFHEVQALLERGKRLGAAGEDVQRILADLYLARYLDAVVLNDPVEQSIYLDLVRRHDPSGRLDAELTGSARVRIVTEPAGAEVFLFRLAELPERRLAPVPWKAALGSRPSALNNGSPAEGREPKTESHFGEWALRIVRGADGIRPGDLILELAGFRVRDLILVAECPASGEVQRFDRLVAIDGLPVRDEYEANWLGGSGWEGTREFTFERGRRRFTVQGESLAAMGIVAAGPRAVAERGGVSARLWRDGEVSEMELPAGPLALSVRLTAAPVFIGPEAYLGRTPLDEVHLEGGVYLAVLRRDGHEDMRHPLHIVRGGPAELNIQLAPIGATPEGWIRVPQWSHASPIGGPRSLVAQGGPGFWIMEREVTMREYFEFLNDPETLAEVDAHAAAAHGGRAPRVPSASGTAAPRLSEGNPDGPAGFTLPANWSWEWPALGVTWHDAQAFAEWKTRRARAAGRNETYALPTLEDWTFAAGFTNYRYVFGSRFHPKWVSSCFTRPGPPTPGAIGPKPEPPMSFPIDESIFGVYDMAGSVSEWIDDWWIEDSGMRRFAGGSWAHADPEDMFAIYGGNGARPEISSGTIGFRLVMRKVSGVSDQVSGKSR